ncbi:COX assembly mitochondrial protein 2 homolog [Dermacentor variabilis]|uniref:COX assembly mitochondrial protein 2 homolog n=1 Tax=Dermacentor variabilis TaxID=34621 RepID=UPI003F5B3C79
MHTDLSPHLHSEECNNIIALMKQCYEENKWAKFIGACNDVDVAMRSCLKKERLEKRAKNYDKSYAKRFREKQS